MQRVCSALLAAAVLSGCGPTTSPPLYYWGSYEPSIHVRYSDNDPVKVQEYLEEIIREGTTGGKGRVPPGVFADYGLLLYQQGRGAEAIQYFQKEATAFPESAPLMTKLIARVGNGTAPDKAVGARPLPSTAPPQASIDGPAAGATAPSEDDRGTAQAPRGEGG